MTPSPWRAFFSGLLNDNDTGKLENGRRPRAAFGNSTGDRQMLEYPRAGDGHG
jgi:hypothetical protein